MATITGFTADRMLQIENSSVTDGEIRPDGHLWLIQHDGHEIDAGPAIGPPGPQGPMGPAAVSSIPGEVKLWPGSALPDPAKYGKWVWADGAIYVIATYPLAAAAIAPQWRTFGGASDPGANNFRVPDIRGLVPAGLDAMPGGTRANRMTRAVAITLAAKTGEETHIVSVGEMPVHAHTITDPTHYHGINDPGHTHTGIKGAGATNTNIGSQMAVPDAQPMTPNSSITGIAIAAAYTGINGTNNNGSGGAHENVQPTVFVPYIVRLDG